MDEFTLIKRIIDRLGPSADGPGVIVGPGDDASIVQVDAQQLVVSSLDTLVADRHFPSKADAALVGYRAVMVSASDLAAMGAEPTHILVGLTLPNANVRWAERLAEGMAQAAAEIKAPITGGNMSKGPLSITMSVHGQVPPGLAMLRNGAAVGDRIYVSGVLGAAAAAVEFADLISCTWGGDLNGLEQRYYMPMARTTLGVALRGFASSCIDISDSLLQDLSHICNASDVGAELHSEWIPTHEDAGLQEALMGGDDYELLFTSPRELNNLPIPVTQIGEVVEGMTITMDGRPVKIEGYQHF